MYASRLLLVVAALAMAQPVFADRKDKKDRGPDVAPVTHALYQKECGSCHMAYQPGLLPARSWEKLMGELASHFGDNAELAAGERKAITDYLVANAGDQAREKRARKIYDSIPRNSTPLRISETPYFVKEHREIPARLVKDNPKVKSLAQCNACHTQADRGSYRESEIDIPGHGRWKD